MVQEAAEWEGFTNAIGRADLRDDPRFREPRARRANAAALIALLDGVFRAKSQAEWRAALDAHGVTFGIVACIEDLPDDPQLNANGVFRPVEGDGLAPGLRTVDSPLHLDGAPKRPATRAPTLGEHGREILMGLGYSGERIDELVRDGVVRE
jgi:formyl-CoA transferase